MNKTTTIGALKNGAIYRTPKGTFTKESSTASFSHADKTVTIRHKPSARVTVVKE